MHDRCWRLLLAEAAGQASNQSVSTPRGRGRWGRLLMTRMFVFRSDSNSELDRRETDSSTLLCSFIFPLDYITGESYQILMLCGERHRREKAGSLTVALLLQNLFPRLHCKTPSVRLHHSHVRLMIRLETQRTGCLKKVALDKSIC